jgi:2-amino-4-hydroxy-6-hydroxymethyldihydropteridine diphosphokinase
VSAGPVGTAAENVTACADGTRATPTSAATTASFTRDTVPVNDENPMKSTAYVGLGANLGDREGSLRRALDLLAEETGIVVAAVSTFRETEPVGYLDQPRFVNAAARLETELTPRGLLAALLGVERKLGRDRSGPRFGPRKVDLDLLLFDELELDEEGLTVPHPRLHERAFVLEPLAELAPGLVVPGRGSVERLLAELD